MTASLVRIPAGRHAESTRIHLRLHWLVTGSVLGGALWSFLIAVVAAAFGNWTLAGVCALSAAVLAGLLALFLTR